MTKDFDFSEWFYCRFYSLNDECILSDNVEFHQHFQYELSSRNMDSFSHPFYYNTAVNIRAVGPKDQTARQRGGTPGRVAAISAALCAASIFVPLFCKSGSFHFDNQFCIKVCWYR